MHSVIAIFIRPKYTLIATSTALALFIFMVLVPNAALVGSVITNENISLGNKIAVFVSLLGGIGMSMGNISAVVTVLVSILFGANVALVAHLAQRRSFRAAQGGTVAGFAGASVGALGIGCVSCGTLALTAVFPLIGSTGLFALLPLRGIEFGIVGIVALLLSIYFLARRIKHGAVCEITL